MKLTIVKETDRLGVERYLLFDGDTCIDTQDTEKEIREAFKIAKNNVATTEVLDEFETKEL